ncbi:MULTISPECIES: hypothetical protein [Pseudoalteromonas]|jgi:hypothetical protein|uniref:hypothetical protein n=1 Tax=Pseudoalteromonas TaxID=53246 RepID=UPI000C7CA26E|nr:MULTISPECIES: hypothetical protein [Pseudoalteromonas]AUJ69949.1 hypothetical protein PNC201_08275 [Pseudoalteromonas sp. NC201]MBR8844748.1 hypothetical protein [Pseudoalteromonas sp. JC3]MCF7513069.1 hypothetical protein [Pseudoalteromonas sp. L7]MCF7525109.1 hypothetical protein [Pseudoalteromonas sp. L23]MCG7553812.1 hypothetical protein [Pseudoalteromonas sp. Of11M-6]
MNRHTFSPQNGLRSSLRTDNEQIIGTRAYEYKQLVEDIKPIQGLREKLQAFNRLKRDECK